MDRIAFFYSHDREIPVRADFEPVRAIANLDSNFEQLWHQISVAAWNQDPVESLLNDGATPIPAAVGDPGTIGISAEAAGSMDFLLPLYSRDIQILEFAGGTSAQEQAELARLRLDLSQVPSDVMISALVETTGGWLEPLLLSEPEVRFCRMAIGPATTPTRRRLIQLPG